MKSFRIIWVVWLLQLSCGDDATSHGDASTSRPDGKTDASLSAGKFLPSRAGVIDLTEGSVFQRSNIAMYLNDREFPLPQLYTLLGSEGDCEVWAKNEPAFCKDCDGICVASDTCEPYPVTVDAGTVTVDGLTADLSFTYQDGFYQTNFAGDKFEPDLFAPNANIALSTTGPKLSGLTLTTQGVEPLEADLPTVLALTDDVDTELQWTAEQNGVISVQLLVGWHGSSPLAYLICETTDDGNLTIPGALITMFPRDTSFMEQHASFMARLNRDVKSTEFGDVELKVASQKLILQLDRSGGGGR